MKIRARVLGPLAVFASLAVAAPAANADLVWRITGAGFGHGIGMSQYGAAGLARHGASWTEILSHYYLGTTIGTVTPGQVRVLLAPDQPSVSFSGVDQGCGYRLFEAKTYEATPSPKGIVLRNQQGVKRAQCSDVVDAQGGPSFLLGGKGEYRGVLELRQSGPGAINAINAVPIDDYVRGVVAAEMPSRFPLDALRAQAVAARSYALATTVGGDGFNLYDDTRSQVYGGVGAETARSDQAVADTTREVVAYKGEIAITFFSSTSGGHTENVENVFEGAPPRPYLRGVPDPYDGASPYHRWTETLSPEAMDAALSGLVKGRLEKIDVTQRGASPRIISADLVGTDGTTKVDGETLASRLGLRDRWAYFNELHVGPEAKPARFRAPWQPL
jgi:stage II sporulation protein D